MQWTIVNGSVDMLGFIPSFLSESDPRPACEQLDGAYAHGGGWFPFDGFKLNSASTVENWHLLYTGDPPMRLIGYTRLRAELIAVFEYAWVAIVASDGSYEIARMD